jgi:hypothetical protein
MNIVHARCCGLDVHKRTVVACLLISRPGEVPSKEVRTFSAMTDDAAVARTSALIARLLAAEDSVDAQQQEPEHGRRESAFLASLTRELYVFLDDGQTLSPLAGVTLLRGDYGAQFDLEKLLAILTPDTWALARLPEVSARAVDAANEGLG